MRPESDIAALADRLAIVQVLTLYSRGIDRCDLDALTATFWPDASAQYGAEPQNAHAWAAATLAALKGMRRTAHALSNMLITLDGDTAQAETYCTAYHEIEGPEGPIEMVVGGRYLDRLEKRDGDWRRLPTDLTLNACVQALYAGRCVRAGEAAYGRWGEETLRLAPKRVEISDDNRTFRPLVDQGPNCATPQIPG